MNSASSDSHLPDDGAGGEQKCFLQSIFTEAEEGEIDSSRSLASDTPQADSGDLCPAFPSNTFSSKNNAIKIIDCTFVFKDIRKNSIFQIGIRKPSCFYLPNFRKAFVKNTVFPPKKYILYSIYPSNYHK